MIHTLVHSVAFAPADAMKNDFLLTKREDFATALDISVYSLIAVARAATPLMTEGGSHPHAHALWQREDLPQLQRDGSGQGGT